MEGEDKYEFNYHAWKVFLIIIIVIFINIKISLPLFN